MTAASSNINGSNVITDADDHEHGHGHNGGDGDGSINSLNYEEKMQGEHHHRQQQNHKQVRGREPRVGVADYFAILGVGENLVWKHAKQQQQEEEEEQQQQQQQEEQQRQQAASNDAGDQDVGDTSETEDFSSESQTPHHTAEKNDANHPFTTTIPEEDDAMLLERFYREIVDCDIVTILPSQHSQHQLINQLHQPTSPGALSPGGRKGHDHHRYHQHPAINLSSSFVSTNHHPQGIISTEVLSSPNVSWDASSIGGAGPTNGGERLNETEIEPPELEGWTVIKLTRPASLCNNNIPQSQEATPSSISKPIWSKGQTWDANLNPMTGITSELQALQLQHYIQERELQERARHNQSPSSYHSNSQQHQAPLQHLKRRVQSQFQARQQQWLTPNKNSNNDSADKHINPLLQDQPSFYLSYKRRSPDELNLPAIADVELKFVRIHKSIAVPTTRATGNYQEHDDYNRDKTSACRPSSDTGTGTSITSTSMSGAATAALFRIAEAGKNAVSSRLHHSATTTHIEDRENDKNLKSTTLPSSSTGAMGADTNEATGKVVALETLLELPNGYTEWVIPSVFSKVRIPSRTTSASATSSLKDVRGNSYRTSVHTPTSRSSDHNTEGDDEADSYGIETVDRTPSRAQRDREWKMKMYPRLMDTSDPAVMEVAAATAQSRQNQQFQLGGVGSFGLGSIGRSASTEYDVVSDDLAGDVTELTKDYYFVPVLALRRQRVGDEERFKEDPALVEMALSFMNDHGKAILPSDDLMFNDDADDDEGDEIGGAGLLGKTTWGLSGTGLRGLETSDSGTDDELRGPPPISRLQQRSGMVGAACILVRHNVPMGFCDSAFTTSVLDRFPYKNYKGLPLPEEELPMFCYPTGCRLHRARFSDAPLPQYYGFVVKNERGDSIYVSCVSFMEPLTIRKKQQLARMSEKRRRASLPHKNFCAARLRHRQKQRLQQLRSINVEAELNVDVDDTIYFDQLLTGFDEMTTFENKTICIVSRFPYWTAFRRFLSHIHSMAGSSSELPLERCISHLLLSVPVPKPGGPNILIPLPTFNVPMHLSSPPLKDLPLVDLPYERLVACLDVPTIVTLVLGFLTLERKVIVMSTRPSLVLDVCELLRSLLFPFELAAPYVPRLTEPFMSCLEFPGAIFAGIHDDGTPHGLAAIVRRQMPEDSTIVDLDTGKIDCSGDRMAVLDSTWGVIPPGPRSKLVAEIEALCRDASIVPGQEPLDSLLDSAFDASVPSNLVEDDIPLRNEDKEPLDDRAIRDAFLRFFCSVLAGYEQHLVVPDVDFLISGNEWFNSNDFLASASEEKAPFLGSLVSTQLFQSFIQRRTESSDVHLLLFDECIQEYLSSSVPYGRLGGDVETVRDKESGKSHLVYSLLIDQSSDDCHQSVLNDRSFDGESRDRGSETDNSSIHQMNKSVVTDITERLMIGTDFCVNASGDWVTMPKTHDIPHGTRYSYCVDGNPTFPDRLDSRFYSPREPESWLVEMKTAPTPMLTRSSKEIEEADRRRKFSTSYRGMQSQRKCLWQLPKLMGSHFLGTWLMCMPALVSQPFLSHGQQSRYILRAFGALRLLRSKQKIIPDESAYRALIVACGRTMTDRRTELVSLFGLLRSDGINPSAVTLGQYTKALAEGYSKRAIVDKDIDQNDQIIDVSAGVPRQNPETLFEFLDVNLGLLEESGRKWRQRPSNERGNGASQQADDLNASIIVPGTHNTHPKKRNQNKLWLPVMMTSSCIPTRSDDVKNTGVTTDEVELLAVWSRTTFCEACGYIPLDEEVQGGWDAIYGAENDLHGAINCPRCGSFVIPKLAYKHMSVDDASALDIDFGKTPKNDSENSDFGSLPPQIRPSIDEEVSLVTYLSPSSLRLALEHLVDVHGEDILEREKLRSMDREIFYNYVWYCARFSLPLSLPIAFDGGGKKANSLIAVIGWDQKVAYRGCYSCGRVISSLLSVSGGIGEESESTFDSIDFSEHPLLSKFNLSGYYASVWDHPDLSEILVTLVEACDKRDFRPVVECVLKCNKRRQEKFGTQAIESTASGSEVGSSYITPALSESDGRSSALSSIGNTVELDCYRTVMYLAKYQCTSAFHAFFPATLKPCKGYHFWCPVAPVPIFDRLFREAVERLRTTKSATLSSSSMASAAHTTASMPVVYDVSDIALGFRSVFGHLI